MVAALDARHVASPTAADAATLGDVRIVTVHDETPDPLVLMAAVALRAGPRLLSVPIALLDVGQVPANEQDPG